MGLVLLGMLAGCSEPGIVDEAGAALRLEPESVNTVADAQAEGGEAVALWGEGDVASFSLGGVPEACYDVKVRVRADLYEGAPKLRLSLDDQPIGEPKPVQNEAYIDQAFGSACLTGGRIDAALLEDRYEGAGKDRNLYVDTLILERAETGGQPAPKPEPIVPPSETDDALELTIDVSAKGGVARPVGLALTPVQDDERVGAAAQDVGAKALRWDTMGAYFDKSAAPKFKVGVQDPDDSMAWTTDDTGHRTLNLPFDDFIALTKRTGAEPILIVPIHSAIYEGALPHGDWDTVVQAAADWVEYANVIKGYGVKRWEIGNEVDLNGWSPEQYARMVEEVSAAMKAVDPSVEISANGMTGKGWWDAVMPTIADDIDFLVTHQYSWYESYDQWAKDPYTVGGSVDDAVYARGKYLPGAPIILTEVSSLKTDQATEANSVWRALHNVEVQAMAMYKGADQSYFWASRWFGDESADMTRAFDAEYEPLATGVSLEFLNRFVGGTILNHDPLVSNSVRSWSFADGAGGLTVLVLNKATEPQNLNVNLQNYAGSPQNRRVSLIGDTPNVTDIRVQDEDPVGATADGFSLTLPGLSVTAVQLGARP